MNPEFLKSLIALGLAWIFGAMLGVYNVRQARKEREERMRIYRLRKQRQNEALKKKLGLEDKQE
jgi:hypothetical protein